MFTNYLKETQEEVYFSENVDEIDLNIFMLEAELEQNNLTNTLLMLEAEMNVKGAYAKVNGDEVSLNEAIETLNEGVKEFLSDMWRRIQILIIKFKVFFKSLIVKIFSPSAKNQLQKIKDIEDGIMKSSFNRKLKVQITDTATILGALETYINEAFMNAKNLKDFKTNINKKYMETPFLDLELGHIHSGLSTVVNKTTLAIDKILESLDGSKQKLKDMQVEDEEDKDIYQEVLFILTWSKTSIRESIMQQSTELKRILNALSALLKNPDSQGSENLYVRAWEEND